MEKRTLGKTGWQASILGLGGGENAFTTCDWKESVAIVHRLLDAGVNYLDTAPTYDDSEDRIGEVMRTRRAEVFLSTKVNERTREGAAAQLKRSLERLQTDHVDQVNLHNVFTFELLDRVMEPDGALAALEEARRAGLLRFIGITNHRDPSVLAQALERYPFASALMPVNLLDPDFMEVVGPVARRQGVPLIAMKTYAADLLLPWREAAFRYTLSQPGLVLAAIGVRGVAEVEENLRYAESFRPSSLEEQAEAMRTAQAAVGRQGWWRQEGGVPDFKLQPRPAPR